MTAVRKSLPCDQFLKASQNATLIVSAMATAVQGSSKLRTEILFVLSSNRLRQPLQELQAIAPSSMRDSEEGCADHEICPTSLAETQRGLRLRICSLFLETALLASPDQAGMDTALAISLLQKQVEFSPPIPACAYGSRYSHGVGKSSLPIAEQTYTTDQDRASADWRTRLSSDLLQEATTRSDMILRKVGEICRDLEDRCKMVEQPLAEEQGRSKALIILLQTSRARVAELESQAEQRSLLFKGIDADKAELQSQVQAGERRLKELSDVLENVESKLEEANAEVERSDTAAKEAAYDHDLKHRAIMSTKDETIDEQTELIAQLEGELEGLRKQHAATSQAESIAQDKVVALEARLVEITHTVEAEKTSNIQKESEIEQLRSIETKLRSEIGVLNNKMEQGVRRIEALQSEVQSANASSDETMEKLGMLRESDKLVATEEVARLRHAHGAEIRKLHANVQEATQIAASESREKDLRVSELERKVERFRNEREVKAKEFAEVQDLSRKLMAVMGRRTEQSVHLTSDKITSETSEPSVDTPVGQQAIHRLRTAKSSQLFESSTSSKSSPTSKRTRPRRNAKTPSLQQAKIDLGAKTVKTAHNAMSPSPRRPLEDVGVNIYNLSPVKTQQHVGTKGREGLDREMSVASQYDALMEIGDLSFSGSDVFTSTERQRSPAPHHSSRTELYDETTADFQ